MVVGIFTVCQTKNLNIPYYLQPLTQLKTLFLKMFRLLWIKYVYVLFSAVKVCRASTFRYISFYCFACFIFKIFYYLNKIKSNKNILYLEHKVRLYYFSLVKLTFYFIKNKESLLLFFYITWIVSILFCIMQNESTILF